MKKRGFTIKDAEEHARKHRYALEATVGGRKVPGNTIAILGQASEPRRGRMNKTEQRFSAILEAKKQTGEIIDYKFEGITLRWGEDDEGRAMRYTPDFVIFRTNDGKPVLIEVKGPHIRYKDSVRFKGCRAEWRKYFGFQMWQEKKRDEWKLVA